MTHPKRPLSPKPPAPRRSFFRRIPESRQPFYAALLGIFSFVGACGASREFYLAIMSRQIEAFTGPKGHRIREIISYDVEPARFGWNVACTFFMILALAAAAFVMFRRLRRRCG